MPTATMANNYELPNSPAATQAMRDLQMKATGGLSGLMSQDTSAQRAGIQKALYDSAAEGINTAADRNRMAMLEGTFGRGVGPSSITVELAGRQQQEQSDALARAARDAYTGAAAEQRADLASQLGLYNTGLAGATTGLQGDANVALANLARQQQQSQFDANLAFQGNENALNRSQQADQFGRNLNLQYDQLAQQNDQFGRNLDFQGTQNQLNRDFTGTQNDLSRQLQQTLAQMGYDFQGNQAQLNRDFTGAQNQANRVLTQTQNQQQQDWQAAENQANRALTQTQAQQQQDWLAGQNQLSRDAQMAQLLLQIANQQDIASGNQLSGGIGAGIGGLATLLAPLLAELFGNGGH